MKTLKVPGMMCQMCVKRIKNAMNEAGIQVQIDLATKTVTVSEDAVDKVIDLLDALGFEVVS